MIFLYLIIKKIWHFFFSEIWRYPSILLMVPISIFHVARNCSSIPPWKNFWYTGDNRPPPRLPSLGYPPPLPISRTFPELLSESLLNPSKTLPLSSELFHLSTRRAQSCFRIDYCCLHHRSSHPQAAEYAQNLEAICLDYPAPQWLRSPKHHNSDWQLNSCCWLGTYLEI